MKHVMQHVGPALSLWLALVAGCATGAPDRAAEPVAEALAEIARLEDARTNGRGQLSGFLEHPEPGVRARAATALGRLWWPEEGAAVTEALMGALEDEQAEVRAAAAFALGMRGDPAAGEVLAKLGAYPREADPHPIVRARAIEALSKLDRPDLHTFVLMALRDTAAGVRLEAAVGPHRWPADGPGAYEINRALIEQLGNERERSVAEACIFALQRRASPEAPEAMGVFLSFSRSPRPIERLYGVRGLKALAPHPDVRTPLVKATRDPDWRVACEATLALAEYPMRPTYATLDEGTQSLNPHVRRCAWETVGAQLARSQDPGDRELWADAFAGLEALDDTSVPARAAYVGARQTFLEFGGQQPLDAEAVLEALESGESTDDEWIATAQALGRAASWSGRDAMGQHDPAADRARSASLVEALDVLARQASRRVGGAAIEALGEFPPADSRSVLHALLEHPDLGLRLAAVLALTSMADAEDVPPLARAFESSTGDIGSEVRFNALRVAAEVGDRSAEKLLRRGLNDARPFVRRVARTELIRLNRSVPATRAASPLPDLAPGSVPDALAGVELPARDAPNPIVLVETTRGTMTFELFPDEAPVHVHNFLTLAARGTYDGLIFHRVVPDFVIQGGDYRGDGNGGMTFRGVDSLRHEIGPRKYVRGSLGMPRNEDPDSGGGQLFVTHRPTPHLDGRYTIFGELRDGFDVLDAIEVGDRMLGVQVSRP